MDQFDSMAKSHHISVVTPVYGCGDSLIELYNRLSQTLSRISDDYEIIMVNDDSPDDAWDTIKSLAEMDSCVKGINLSRNFGQHYAITAGLDFSNGDWTVVMDCDLQDQPEEILRFYKVACGGYDVVVGKRADRKDTWLKKITSAVFYKVYNYLTDSKFNSQISNFGIYSRDVISSIKKMREQNRSFGLFIFWSGFLRIEIEIAHSQRAQGKSSYSFSKLFNLAFDSIVAYSNKPLILSVKLGFALSMGSFIYSVWLVLRYFLWANPVQGWTSLILSLYFLAGLIIGNIGIVGLYIGKVFNEVKKRPLYFVKEVTGNVVDMD